MMFLVETAPVLQRQLLVDLFTAMVRIRLFEEAVADLVDAGEIATPCHLYIGQEAIAAGVCAALRQQDYVWGGHRSHGHYLAKGADLAALMAELFARATGCAHGRGGSMHVVAPSHGILGTVPLVAATIPLAVGTALASKLRRDGRVSVSFFGDGAVDEGHCHESLNLAALYKLPLVFVCENNFYASHMALAERRAADNIAEHGRAHGLPAATVDGNDVLAVHAAAADAVARARDGRGPTLVECRTYRWRGHVGASWDMDVGVRRRDELGEWLGKDPIARLEPALEDAGVGRDIREQIRAGLADEIAWSVEAARSAPPPDASTLHDRVFVP